MKKNLSDRASSIVGDFGATLKSCVKVALQSKRPTITRSAPEGETLIVMGNGPSLADSIKDYFDILKSHKLLAVNFAANTGEFKRLRPGYYVLADPLFFVKGVHNNVDQLYENLDKVVEWDMTLYVPAKMYAVVRCLVANPRIKVEAFNPVGFEGFGWAENIAFGTGLGMPRPRNVLIPAIMCGILAGYRKIAIAGADHSWMRTIEVNENNEVISVQPHFYTDSKEEKSRVTTTYLNYRLHDIVYSFYVAFKSYFAVRRFAERRGVEIINVTPGSFIDAFPRMSLGELTS